MITNDKEWCVSTFLPLFQLAVLSKNDFEKDEKKLAETHQFNSS